MEEGAATTRCVKAPEDVVDNMPYTLVNLGHTGALAECGVKSPVM